MAVNHAMPVSPLQVEVRCGRPQVLRSRSAEEFSGLHSWAMAHSMAVTYWEAYAAARSCLSALADLPAVDDPARFDSLLIALDGMHGGVFPCTYPMAGTAADLLARFENAVDRMIDLGGNALSLELVLAGALFPPMP